MCSIITLRLICSEVFVALGQSVIAWVHLIGMNVGGVTKNNKNCHSNYDIWRIDRIRNYWDNYYVCSKSRDYKKLDTEISATEPYQDFLFVIKNNAS